MNRLLRLSFALALLALVACSGLPSRMNARDDALSDYGAAIRWSEFGQAESFLDPVTSQQPPLRDMDRERFKLIQVTGYEVKSKQVAADSGITQTVEIRVVTRNTQLEHIITDHQTWRWDPVAKRYWLASGLPDFSAH